MWLKIMVKNKFQIKQWLLDHARLPNLLLSGTKSITIYKDP